MNKKTIILSIIIFALIVAGMFTFAFLKKAEIAKQEDVDAQQPEEQVEYASITRIEGKHYFIDDVHTVVGELILPTPCDLLEVESFVAESYPEQITLDFNVINNAEFCAQQQTAQRYKVSAPASGEASFTARFMGREVELNLIPAAPGETPDDFELFIKG